MAQVHNNEDRSAKKSISDGFGLVKESRHSEIISDEKCYLYRSMLHFFAPALNQYV